MAAHQEGRLKEHEAADYRSTGSRYTFAEPTGRIIDAADRKVQGKSAAATREPQNRAAAAESPAVYRAGATPRGVDRRSIGHFLRGPNCWLDGLVAVFLLLLPAFSLVLGPLFLLDFPPPFLKRVLILCHEVFPGVNG